MKKKAFIYIFLCLFSLPFISKAQDFHLTDQWQDFTPVEKFYEIADSIRWQGAASAALWTSYFQIPVIQLFRHNPNFDSTEFVKDVQQIFSSNGKINEATLNDQQVLLAQYKKSEKRIKSSIYQMKKEPIKDSIKEMLFPYLKKSLRSDSIIPRQLYMVLEEGNGGLPGYVFNSMLQTAKLNGYKVAAIAAHESYHSIVDAIFNKRFTTFKDLNGFQKRLLYFMEIVAEEGIADLIDKPVLGQKQSPLYTDVKRLSVNEDAFAITNLNKLDSLLNSCLVKEPDSFDFRAYSKNGGHIPGRYMTLLIQKAGLLKGVIEQPGNPLAFFEAYLKASQKLDVYPALSKSALSYLQKVYTRT